MRIQTNETSFRSLPLQDSDRHWFGLEAVPEVKRYLKHIPYENTPLISLGELSKNTDIDSVLIKDESRRSKLGSFKALGGGHAVIRLVLKEASRILGRYVAPEELFNPDVQKVAREITVSCATDGNHGRAVAAGAKIAGASSQIFVHQGVSTARADAIAAEGAVVTRVNGNYDDSLEAINITSKENGWLVVSDTSWPGYEDIPATVMQGYLVMASEAADQALALGKKPTHVFLQAGVGGYAAAVAAHLFLRFESSSPKFVVVEPSRAACIFESAVRGEAIRITPKESTMMSMLECYEPSSVAWRILARLSTAFTVIEEDDALNAMQILGRPLGGDPAIVAGESGGAGLAGALACARNADARKRLGMDESSVVLVFNTEGATDKVLYEKLMAQGRAEP